MVQDLPNFTFDWIWKKPIARLTAKQYFGNSSKTIHNWCRQLCSKWSAEDSLQEHIIAYDMWVECKWAQSFESKANWHGKLQKKNKFRQTSRCFKDGATVQLKLSSEREQYGVLVGATFQDEKQIFFRYQLITIASRLWFLICRIV
jgi:hypothetical protein